MGEFFPVQAGGGRYPDKPSPASAAAAADFLRRRAGFNRDASETAKMRTVTTTMKSLTALQGCKLWDIPTDARAVELSKEQKDLIGRGYAGPPVDIEDPVLSVLSPEQRQRCQGGLDEEQLKMIKAMVQHHLPSFHEIIDRAVVAREARVQARDASHLQQSQSASKYVVTSRRNGGRTGFSPVRRSASPHRHSAPADALAPPAISAADSDTPAGAASGWAGASKAGDSEGMPLSPPPPPTLPLLQSIRCSFGLFGPPVANPWISTPAGRA